MIENLFFDAKKATVTAHYTDGTHEEFSTACSEYQIDPTILPFNGKAPVLILTSLVFDLIHRVKELEFTSGK